MYKKRNYLRRSATALHNCTSPASLPLLLGSCLSHLRPNILTLVARFPSTSHLLYMVVGFGTREDLDI